MSSMTLFEQIAKQEILDNKSYIYGTVYGVWQDFTLEVFTGSPQYKNANIANFVSAVPLKMTYTTDVWDIEM